MDFLNQTTAQVRDVFASMTPGARVTAGLLVAVVVVSLGFLFQTVSAGPDEFLFGGDPVGRGRLPGMEGALSSANIDYTVEGTRIKVARKDKNAAIAAIADADQLPPEFHNLMREAMDGGGMFDFRDIKMARIRAAREQQTSLILNEFSWIGRAQVIHNVRQKAGLRNGRHATAAVSVLPAPGESLTTHRVRTVKNFVSKALDVPVESVEVTNQGVESVMADGGPSPDDFEHPLYRLKATEERKIRTAILSQLDFIDGVRVQVNAQIDEVSEQRVVATEPSGEAVNLSRATVDTTENQTLGLAGDRVGVRANEAIGPNGAGRDETLARSDQVQKTSNADDRKFGVGVTTTETVSAGFALKEADASVAVPMSYVEAVYRRENPEPDGSAPEQINAELLKTVQGEIQTTVEEIVQPLLPRLSLGENKFRQVKVKFVRDLPGEPLPEPSLATNALGWLGDNANTLAMAGLAVFSLVMLRSMVTSTGKDGPVGGLPALQLDGEPLADAAGGEDDEEMERPKLKLRKADTLKDDLTEMVGSDPDAAAAILRSWINNAA